MASTVLFGTLTIIVSSTLPIVLAMQPNLLLIVADDLGYGDLSTFGHPTAKDPNLSQLAKESLVMTNFYATSPVCSPSRASLLTGLYPTSTGIWPGVLWPDSLGGLHTKHKTLATRLKSSGYVSAMVGKWHLGVGIHRQYLPTHHGFDHYLGIPYSHDMCPCIECFPDEQTCYDPCRPEMVGCPLFKDTTIVEQPTSLTSLTYKYTEAGKQFMEKSVLEDKAPFFLNVAYHQTHHPQFANSSAKHNPRGHFGAALSEMDESVGQLLSKIDQLGIRNNTMVIFTSDNGPSLMRHVRGGCAGPFRCGKGTTWEGGVRVPAFFNWNGMIRPGRSSDILTALDIVPTFMSILGHAEVAQEVHGVDLTKQIFLPQFEGRRQAFLYTPSMPSPHIGMMAIRMGKYKAHFYTEGSSLSDDFNIDHECSSLSAKLTKHWPPLLFNVDSDPGERYPLDPVAFAETIKEMTDLRNNLSKNISWAPSEVLKGRSQRAFPCCNDHQPTSSSAICHPFPSCCNCSVA